MEKSSLYLEQELSKKVVLKLWHEDGSIQEILQKISFQPDFILLNDYKPDYCPFVWGFNNLTVPVGAIMHDLKYKMKRRNQFYQMENIQYIFTIYRDAALKWFPELKDRFIWFPHHVAIDIFHDYRLPKEHNFLMSGAMIKHLYPSRVRMMEIMEQEPGFKYLPHPGYLNLDHNQKNSVIGSNYAKEINRSFMHITCDSIDHFPLLKYFETLACRTLLLATPSKELEDLGFVDGETFVAVDEKNVKEKAYYYLTHETEREKICQKGYEMVTKRHSTKERVEELIEHISTILNSR